MHIPKGYTTAEAGDHALALLIRCCITSPALVYVLLARIIDAVWYSVKIVVSLFKKYSLSIHFKCASFYSFNSINLVLKFSFLV